MKASVSGSSGCYALKSAMPSATNCTAIAKSRKPKMRLIAPAAPGPRRFTSGPPSRRNKYTTRPSAMMPMTMPR